MEWSLLYNQEHAPSLEETDGYINSGLWQDLNTWLQQKYSIRPNMEYSKCAGARGWNIKYKKSGRSLCTLYPMPGYFIALVVIGNKELTEAELVMPTCCSYTQNLFAETRFSCGGRWLMMHVKTPDVLEDVKKLITVRASIKNK